MIHMHTLQHPDMYAAVDCSVDDTTIRRQPTTGDSLRHSSALRRPTWEREPGSHLLELRRVPMGEATRADTGSILAKLELCSRTRPWSLPNNIDDTLAQPIIIQGHWTR